MIGHAALLVFVAGPAVRLNRLRPSMAKAEGVTPASRAVLLDSILDRRGCSEKLISEKRLDHYQTSL
jgi:hypothetical protein